MNRLPSLKGRSVELANRHYVDLLFGKLSPNHVRCCDEMHHIHICTICAFVLKHCAKCGVEQTARIEFCFVGLCSAEGGTAVTGGKCRSQG